jgi:hypothetical protein
LAIASISASEVDDEKTSALTLLAEVDGLHFLGIDIITPSFLIILHSQTQVYILRIFINPIPLYPPSPAGKGEVVLEGGFAPLFSIPPLNNEPNLRGCLRGANAPLL